MGGVVHIVASQNGNSGESGVNFWAPALQWGSFAGTIGAKSGSSTTTLGITSVQVSHTALDVVGAARLSVQEARTISVVRQAQVVGRAAPEARTARARRGVSSTATIIPALMETCGAFLLAFVELSNADCLVSRAAVRS